MRIDDSTIARLKTSSKQSHVQMDAIACQQHVQGDRQHSRTAKAM